MKKYRLVWRKWPQEHPHTRWMIRTHYWFLLDPKGQCISINNSVEDAMYYLPRRVVKRG
jgi:hypothetical protein